MKLLFSKFDANLVMVAVIMIVMYLMTLLHVWIGDNLCGGLM